MRGSAAVAKQRPVKVDGYSKAFTILMAECRSIEYLTIMICRLSARIVTRATHKVHVMDKLGL